MMPRHTLLYVHNNQKDNFEAIWLFLSSPLAQGSFERAQSITYNLFAHISPMTKILQWKKNHFHQPEFREIFSNILFKHHA